MRLSEVFFLNLFFFTPKMYIFFFLTKCFPLLCTVSIRSRFSDIRRSWLRIVTDIIFCIHGISLLNKIKDQNLEFEEKKNTFKKPKEEEKTTFSRHETVLYTSSIREYFSPFPPFFFLLFFLPSTRLHIYLLFYKGAAVEGKTQPALHF